MKTIAIASLALIGCSGTPNAGFGIVFADAHDEGSPVSVDAAHEPDAIDEPDAMSSPWPLGECVLLSDHSVWKCGSTAVQCACPTCTVDVGNGYNGLCE